MHLSRNSRSQSTLRLQLTLLCVTWAEYSLRSLSPARFSFTGSSLRSAKLKWTCVGQRGLRKVVHKRSTRGKPFGPANMSRVWCLLLATDRKADKSTYVWGSQADWLPLESSTTTNLSLLLLPWSVNIGVDSGQRKEQCKVQCELQIRAGTIFIPYLIKGQLGWLFCSLYSWPLRLESFYPSFYERTAGLFCSLYSWLLCLHSLWQTLTLMDEDYNLNDYS